MANATKTVEITMYEYRQYDSSGNWFGTTFADTAQDAASQLEWLQDHKLYVLEETGEETECAEVWLTKLFDEFEASGKPAFKIEKAQVAKYV